MKNRLIGIFLVTVMLSGTINLYSQPDGELNAIQTVVPFLTIAPDSRAGAMGDAGVATSPDVYSMHWNPAKFAFIEEKAGVGISYSPWLRNLVPDINIAYLSGYYKLDSRQVLSGSLLYSSLGDVDFTDQYGNLERTFTPNEWSLDVAYSRLFTDRLSGGIAFRMIYSNLTGGSYSGGEATKAGISVAADISLYHHTDMTILNKDSRLAFGVNFSNIGSKMSYTDAQTSDFIPMNMRLGTALTMNLDTYNKITLTTDINKLLVPTPPRYAITNPDSIIAGKDPNVSVPVAIFQSFYDAPGGFREELREYTLSVGTEYWYNEQFALRAGYFHENETKGNRKYFTAGAGFRLSGFTVDFSYLMPTVQNHPLARTLRFSIAFDISSAGKKASSNI
ncbi:MAG TPA: type IX secretion system outer membrane channel protein PorV [Bacteroidales bacterium]|nr:type IX secretion system outer membrane channel protein PorV [Bacteroidales bacterium]HOS73601.1 type IX secretion system outer membrane channel protein PorV [Bacteroidales bacterium]HQH24968.1 type IX secretion system outer membrane channel protein PorV [Bacteroidales bacterium]HQJ82621.1 type IX secretion system outer membrane channel protein PorV [Bacteroidales bacterium]